jgi:hypothetical protein
MVHESLISFTCRCCPRGRKVEWSVVLLRLTDQEHVYTSSTHPSPLIASFACNGRLAMGWQLLLRVIRAPAMLTQHGAETPPRRRAPLG